MSGDNKNTKSKRNWHKIATIALSAAMVVIMFITGIYYRAHDTRTQRISKIENEIDKLLSLKASIEQTPTISVDLLTLENSGLPSSAFSSLDAVPAVIRLEHVGGHTAQRISVTIKSYAKILDFLPDETVEEFSHTLSEDGYNLRIDVPRLRRDSKIQATIKCARVSSMEAEVRIDDGVTVEELRSQAKKAEQYRYLTFDDLNKIDPRHIATTEQIDASVEDLRALIRRESGDTDKKDNDSAWSGFLLRVIFPTIAVSALSWFVLTIYFRRVDRTLGKEGNDLGNRIGSGIRDGIIDIGTITAEVQDAIGLPKKMTLVRNQDESSLQWLYEPRASVAYGWQPDLILTFKEDKITNIEFVEYGERDYA